MRDETVEVCSARAELRMPLMRCMVSQGSVHVERVKGEGGRTSMWPLAHEV
jgi:hypothetical protein